MAILREVFKMGILGLFVRSKEEQAVKEAERKQQQREAAEEKEARRQGHLVDLRKGTSRGRAPAKSGGFKGFVQNARRNIESGSGGGFGGFSPHDPFESKRKSSSHPFANLADPFSRQTPKRKAVRKRSGVLIVGGKRYVRV
jgi:hypothetical protein